MCLVAVITPVEATKTLRRFVLVAGANFGGAERELLRYAVSDAERFSRILVEMGGVADLDKLVLKEPSLAEFHAALVTLKNRVEATHRVSERVEVLLYYSGHADEKGLLLGEAQLPYRTLRDALDMIAADVHITVLDACDSGAITRLKGGQRQKAFMVDASSDMKGYAFLTSSSENEAAQESDRLKGSFFTHYLISGLRGAADVTGDGKVTLNEAYQFAFHNTLDRTTQTQGGAQHPAYDIKMTGTGDVVMTDVRQTSASLLLGEHLSGRLFVRDRDQHLVAELRKIAGQTVELGLEPGVYEVQFEQSKTLMHTTVELEKGMRFLLEERHFKSQKREETVNRGSGWKDKLKASRNYSTRFRGKFRVERSYGYWEHHDDSSGWNFAYWPTEHIAANLIFTGFKTPATSGFTSQGEPVDRLNVDVSGQVVTLRIYLPLQFLRSPLRPYIEGGVGRYRGKENSQEIDRVNGVYWGGGLDITLTDHFVLGGRLGRHRPQFFDAQVGGQVNYRSLEYSVGVSLLLF
jgi:hypothetical protein